MNVQGQEPGWHYCWPTDDMVPRYENAGYVFVTHDVVVGDRKINAASQIGGKISIPGGNGVTHYLMRILDEYAKQDDDALQAEIDERESAMKAELNAESDGRYGKVEIAVRNRSLQARQNR